MARKKKSWWKRLLEALFGSRKKEKEPVVSDPKEYLRKLSFSLQNKASAAKAKSEMGEEDVRRLEREFQDLENHIRTAPESELRLLKGKYSNLKTEKKAANRLHTSLLRNEDLLVKARHMVEYTESQLSTQSLPEGYLDLLPPLEKVEDTPLDGDLTSVLKELQKALEKLLFKAGVDVKIGDDPEMPDQEDVDQDFAALRGGKSPAAANYYRARADTSQGLEAEEILQREHEYEER